MKIKSPMAAPLMVSISQMSGRMNSSGTRVISSSRK